MGGHLKGVIVGFETDLPGRSEPDVRCRFLTRLLNGDGARRFSVSISRKSIGLTLKRGPGSMFLRGDNSLAQGLVIDGFSGGFQIGDRAGGV
jgi:hypothetical protein